MERIHSVAIIGAGALGLLYAEALLKVPETSVCFLADGERLARLAGSGSDGQRAAFTVNGAPLEVPVRSPDGLTSSPDLLIVAVKNHHLEDIAGLLSSAGRATTVISVLNGIESEPFLEQHCRESTVLYCVAVGMDAVRTGPDLTYTRRGRLVIGAKDNNQDDPALVRLGELLDRAGLTHLTPPDIHRELWWKWMVNIGVNQVSAVTGATYGVFQQDERAQALMEAAMRETVAVARAVGIDLRDNDVTGWYETLNTLGPDGKTSMLQDMEEGRQTEAPSFGGRLMEIAAEHDIPVPVNETLVRIIGLRESLARG